MMLSMVIFVILLDFNHALPFFIPSANQTPAFVLIRTKTPNNVLAPDACAACVGSVAAKSRLEAVRRSSSETVDKRSVCGPCPRAGRYVTWPWTSISQSLGRSLEHRSATGKCNVEKRGQIDTFVHCARPDPSPQEKKSKNVFVHWSRHISLGKDLGHSMKRRRSFSSDDFSATAWTGCPDLFKRAVIQGSQLISSRAKRGEQWNCLTCLRPRSIWPPALKNFPMAPELEREGPMTARLAAGGSHHVLMPRVTVHRDVWWMVEHHWWGTGDTRTIKVARSFPGNDYGSIASGNEDGGEVKNVSGTWFLQLVRRAVSLDVLRGVEQREGTIKIRGHESHEMDVGLESHDDNQALSRAGQRGAN